MTEDEIRYAAEALGVIPRSKTRPKSLEVPRQRPTGALAQAQSTVSEGIKSAAERRAAEESEAWGQEVAEKATLPQKIMGGLEATAALPAAAITGALGHLGEGFKLLPPGGGTEFVKEKTLIPHGEAGQYYFDVMAGGLEKAADWFSETPVGEFLGSAVDKLPSIFPVSATTAKAVDEGIMGARKGLKLAAEQARKQRQYETGQEGAFYRVRPVTEETGRALRGNKEEAGGGAETPGGPVRGDVPQPITDDALTEVMAQPDNFVRSVASDYAQQVNGRPYELPDMAPSSLLKQAPIGRAFDLAVSENPQYKKAVFEAYGREMPEVIEQSGAKNYDQLVEAAYRQLAKETDDQFRRLPVNMSYHRAGEGNYSDSRDMLRDVYGNRHLYVFQGGDPHPFMSRVDPETGLNDNEKFRAVHDFFGHAIHGNQFGPKGEETAWLAHSQMYSPLARLAMSTETRGQNSVVNYTPLNAKLKARLSEIEGRIYEARRRGQTDDLKELQDIKKGLFEQFQFAPQYGLLLPPEMIRPDFAGKMPDYVRPLIQPAPGTATSARLFHYGKEPGIKVTDPSKYGTGIKGAEAVRLEGAPDIRPRTYFYTDPTKPPEAGLGPYRYRGEADLYNLEEDPLAFRALAAESLRSPFTAKVNPGMVDPSEAITATERLVKEYGYPGYMTPESGTAAVFQPVPVQQYAEGGAVTMAKGGKATKGFAGIAAAREAMKAQRREERVQKNLEAYMGSKEKPQTYYHATQAPKDFRKFDLEKRPTPKSAAAVFLTPSTEWANEFDMADLKTLESATSAAPRIMPMITRAKNTFDYENPEHVQQVMSKVQVPKAYTPEYVAEQISLGNWNFIEDMKVQQAIKDLGFDSFNVKEKGVKNLGVFNPKDVKALFNRGSYDPTTEDISKADGGPVYQGIAKFREARKEARMAIGGSASKKKGSLLSSVSAAREAQKAQRAKDAPAPPAAPAIITPKRAKPGQTVTNPERMAFPGIYKRPDVIAREAAERAAPESPNLKELFGVTREDLYQIARGRQGNLPGILPGLADKPKGMRGGAEQITNKRNTQRILDANAEAERYPQLYKGMDAWYVMDPLYQAFERELGPERAKIEYDMMNKFMGMASPGSEVTTEIPRGSSAYYLHKQGRFPEFINLLGKPFEERGADFPEDIRTVPGHPYHSTAQAGPMQKFVDKGELDMDSPKVPMYIEASGVPEVGFQTETPVGDAHYSRAIGLGDIRKAQNFGKSASNSEMYSLIPWWREKIAGELGIRPVSAQGRTWGVFSPQTGVTTPVGATKLELISDQIVEAARRMNVTPQDALRMFIHGEARLGKKQGGLVALER